MRSEPEGSIKGSTRSAYWRSCKPFDRKSADLRRFCRASLTDSNRRTPSLPWNYSGNWFATHDTVFACFRGFRGPHRFATDCHRLQPWGSIKAPSVVACGDYSSCRGLLLLSRGGSRRVASLAPRADRLGGRALEDAQAEGGDLDAGGPQGWRQRCSARSGGCRGVGADRPTSTSCVNSARRWGERDAAGGPLLTAKGLVALRVAAFRPSAPTHKRTRPSGPASNARMTFGATRITSHSATSTMSSSSFSRPEPPTTT